MNRAQLQFAKLLLVNFLVAPLTFSFLLAVRHSQYLGIYVLALAGAAYFMDRVGLLPKRRPYSNPYLGLVDRRPWLAACYAIFGLVVLVIVLLALAHSIDLLEINVWLLLVPFAVALLLPYFLAAKDHYAELGKD